MAISDKITSIQNHLKDDWDSVESLIGDTELDKNIENISSALDDLYNDLPKVTGSGTSITLDDTRKGRLESTLSGNTSQETTTGKNLFNIEGRYETGTGIEYTKNDDGSYTLNGTANGNNFLRGVYHLNEQHTLSYTSNVSNSNVILRTRTGTPSAQTGIQDQLAVSSTSGNLTSSKQFDFVEISIVSGTTLNNFKIYIQLEKGSSVTSFEPYTGGQASPNPQYPQEVHVVRGDNKINITGRNLLQGVEYGEINSNSGVESDSTTVIRGTNYIPYDTSSTYYVSVNSTLASAGINCRFYNANKEYIGWSTLTGSGRNLYINIGTQVTATDLTPKYLKFRQTLSAGPITSLNDNVMITKVNDMNYEPYSSNSCPINLGMENLFKGYANMTSGFIPSSGSYPTTNTTFPNAKYSLIYLKKGQSISTYGSTNSNGRIRYIDKNTNQVVGGVSTTETDYYKSTADYQGSFAEGTITAKKDFILGIMVLTESSQYSDFQITYGTTPQTISPNPIELGVISTYKDKFIRSSGKNFIDLSSFVDYTSGGITFKKENGLIKVTGTPSSTSWNKRLNVTLPAGTYTFSGVSELNADGLRLELYINDNDRYTIRKNDSSKTFTINEEKTYSLVIWVQSTTDFPTGNITLTPMIEKGTAVTEFEPYGSGEWFKYEPNKKIILNGSETWYQSGNGYWYYTVQHQEYLSKDENSDIISDHFVRGRWNITPSINTICQGNSGNGLIAISKNSFDSIESLTSFLSSNNVINYCTPRSSSCTKLTYEPLLEQLEAYYHAKSRTTQTNISQENNDLPFEIDASALEG